MAVTARSSSAQWRGDLKSGSGELSLGSGAFSGEYSFVSRFEDGDGTNPEELIAAAHAACFSMALSNMLATAGSPATSVKTTATVHLEKVDGAATITRVVLDTVGDVAGIDAQAFVAKAEEAKANCPVSRLLTGATIELNAQFVS